MTPTILVTDVSVLRRLIALLLVGLTLQFHVTLSCAAESVAATHLEWMPQAEPIKFKAPETKSSRWFRKAFGPVSFHFDDLRHPVALLRSAKNRLRWSSPERNALEAIRYANNSSASNETAISRAFEQAALDSALGAQSFDVSMNTTPIYQFRSEWPRVASVHISVSSFVDPRTTPTPTSLPYRSSATQLQMRMHDAMSLLWELDRNSSVVNGEEIGVGLGLRYSF